MIDLDQNATTPLDPDVLDAMRPHWLAGGNPESRHAAGRAARRALDAARESVAAILAARPDEVVFTSGGTEANNLGILGLALNHPRGHLLASPIEHPAVRAALDHLTHDQRFTRLDLPVDPDGRVRLDHAADRLSEAPMRLATLMLASNETGALQPVAELAALAADRGVPVHCDAVQAVGRIPVDFQALGVATLAASAHKFHGPVGAGLLLVRRGVSLQPTAHGGSQQAGRRPGTVPVALAVGLATALSIAHHAMKERTARWRAQQERLESGLIAALGPDRAVVLGPSDPSLRLPQTSLVAFPGCDGPLLLMRLDLAGVCASIGSACASGSHQPAPSLQAMGLPDLLRRAPVRFSFGATTTDADIDQAVALTADIVSSLTTDLPARLPSSVRPG
jgi:cysteine desulfurase